MRKYITASLIAITLVIPAPAHAKTEPTKSCPRYENALRRHGLPVKHFSYLMWRESRCNPLAVSSQNNNGSYDYGALQVNSTWKTVTARVCSRPFRQTKKSLLNLECNLKVSRYLYDNGGLGHWRVTSGTK
jgi:soluble lytic murein transglycosylase-like protein